MQVFKKVKRYLGILLCLVLSILLCGCRDMIFKSEEKPKSTVNLKKTKLEDGTFYVKDGTDFYTLFEPDKSFAGTNDEANARERVIWTTAKEDRLVPTLYKGEPIAYCTTQGLPEDFILERYKDLGYTIGLRGLSQNANGQFEMNVTNGLKKKSSAKKELEKTIDTATICLSSINGKAVSETDISESGTVLGLKKGNTYETGIYIGSLYGATKVKADTHIYQSSETVKLKETRLTKNGYLAIHLPEDLQSGYYYIAGKGLFRYIADEKVNAKKLSKYDYNLPNEGANSYALDDTLEETEKTEVINVKENTVTLVISFNYYAEKTSITNAEIVLPDKTTVKMTQPYENAKNYSYTLENPVPGEYKVIVTGKNVAILEITSRENVSGTVDTKEDADTEPGEIETDLEQENNPAAGTTQKKEQKQSSQKKKKPASSPSSKKKSDDYIYYEVPDNEPLTDTEPSGTKHGK